MYIKLTLQEKLKDERTSRRMTLAELEKATINCGIIQVQLMQGGVRVVLIFGQPHEVIHGKTVVFRQLCKVERAYIRAFVGFIFSQRGSCYACCLFQFRKGHAAAGSPDRK